MRTLCRIGLTFGLAILLVQPAFAQQRQRGQGQGRGGFGQGGVGTLLRNESVQKELKLDADQVTKVNEAVQKVDTKFTEDRNALRDLSQEERRTKQTELNQKISSETYAAVTDILKPDQVKRLKQIELQQAGPRAFTRADVMTALNLNADQKEKLKTITEEFGTKQREMFGGRRAGGGGGGNFQEAREQMANLNKSTMEKITGVLTDDQKKTWKEMTGETFTITVPQRRQDR